MPTTSLIEIIQGLVQKKKPNDIELQSVDDASPAVKSRQEDFKQLLKNALFISATGTLNYYGTWIFEQLGLSAAEYFDYGSDIAPISASLLRISVALMWTRSTYYGLPQIVEKVTDHDVVAKKIAVQNLLKSLPTAITSAVPNAATLFHFLGINQIASNSWTGVGLFATTVLATVTSFTCGNFFKRTLEQVKDEGSREDESVAPIENEDSREGESIAPSGP